MVKFTFDLPRRLAIGLIRFYQLAISPALGPRCRFYPSCSHYTLEALRVHGLLRGLGLGAWRILRCQPLCAGGFDPVPPSVTDGSQCCVGPCLEGDRPS